MRFLAPLASILTSAVLFGVSLTAQSSVTGPVTAISDLHLVEFGTDLALRDQLIEVGGVHADFGRHALVRLDTGDLAALRDVLADHQVDRLPAVRADEVVVYAARDRAGIAPLHGRLLLSRRAFFLTAAPPASLPDDCGGSGFHGGLQAVSLQQDAYRPVETAPVFAESSLTGVPDPVITGMVGQVQQANLQAHVTALSSIFTRRTTAPENAQAITYLTNQLSGLQNITFRTEVFDARYGPNVIAELPGTDLAHEVVMVGAHLDSIVGGSSTARAPGADDNASGSASVLELARIFDNQQFRRTIRFGWWNAEELGLLGSQAYARAARVRGDQIVAYINTDMNAFRANGDELSVDFITNDSTTSLINALQQDIQTYLPGTASYSGSLSGGTSDHRAFFREGFPAVFVFEDIGRYSNYIHTSNDVIGVSANDFVLSTRITQAVLAGSAELAEVAVANPGSFAVFGQGCNGTGSIPGPCGSVNPNGGTLTNDTRTNEYAYRVPSTGAAQLLSFELLTSSVTGGPVTVGAYVYADNGGAPASAPLASTTLTADLPVQFYRATLAAPVTVNGPFWVSLDHSAQTTRLANVVTGETGSSYYRRPPLSGSWLQSGLVTRPAVRTQCADIANNVPPEIGNSGTPQIGRGYDVTLRHAAPLASAVCLIGISDQFVGGLGLPLTIPATGGCQLLVSNEQALSAMVAPTGESHVPLVVPNDPSLIGDELFHQWVVIDPAANNLGVVLSDAARARIGG